ncbi:DUF58 domain-containing protein [Pseudokineococcus lusitanus]|uniref:Uncharacterized protein (DUF58 family) n=1 Tax=Pseudokineococcus lusitanus TaxID=763993 RepID=A0A3N1G995_9ACTN|nr:DUF58 domain-containing protein [Pseudokineococcus lusitanus]ROP26738.1 uncharacterized protein (DUF58 family) [Pseudokineococcus lusitanus]
MPAWFPRVAPTGRLVALVALGAVPVALVPGPWPAVAWAVLVVVLAAVDVALAADPRRLGLERTVPAGVRLGEAVTSELVVTNPGPRRLRGLVRDAWSPSAGAGVDRHAVDVPAGERRRVATPLRPTRRGDRAADLVTVRSRGPLGLLARQRSLPAPATVRVLPHFRSRRHLPSRLARLRDLEGRSAVQVRGQGTEFDSLREYVQGDDVRSIDWRATARRQDLVVRTWRPERDRRVLLVLDTSRTAAGRVGDAPRLDAAMDAALLLAALASRAGDRVDLVALDRRVRARVERADRAALLPALVQAMAPLEARLVEADWSLAARTVRTALTRRALVVLLTPLEPAAVEEGLLPVLGSLSSRHQVLVAAVTDPRLEEMRAARGDVAEVYDAAAAERTVLETDRLVERLARDGVHVVRGTPEELPPRLADAYLALKAAGRL